MPTKHMALLLLLLGTSAAACGGASGRATRRAQDKPDSKSVQLPQHEQCGRFQFADLARLCSTLREDRSPQSLEFENEVGSPAFTPATRRPMLVAICGDYYLSWYDSHFPVAPDCPPTPLCFRTKMVRTKEGWTIELRTWQDKEGICFVWQEEDVAGQPALYRKMDNGTLSYYELGWHGSFSWVPIVPVDLEEVWRMPAREEHSLDP
jgi:hypothetical protein